MQESQENQNRAAKFKKEARKAHFLHHAWIVNVAGVLLPNLKEPRESVVLPDFR